MKILKIISSIITNLIGVWIYLGMLKITSTPFEKVVVGGLGIIFVLVVFYGSTLIRVLQGNSFQTTEQFHRLARLADKSIDLSKEESNLKNTVDEVKTQLLSGYYINLLFNVLIGMIAMFAILSAH